MARCFSDHFLGFVWRPVDMNPAVAQMARQTATRAIVDCSAIDPREFVGLLRQIGATDLKISIRHLMTPGLSEWLRDTAIGTLWIEVHPAFDPFEPAAVLNRMSDVEQRSGCRFVLVTGDPGLLIDLARSDRPPWALGIKGSEASGFVSRETTGILFSILRQIRREHGKCPPLILWGGIATAAAAAAFLATGAKGIVFESLHWQTDLVSADEAQRGRIGRLRPEHTTVIGQALGVPCRLFDKGNSQAVETLRRTGSGSPCQDSTQADRRVFAETIRARGAHALESSMSRQDLVLLSPEAAFAEGFAQRYGRDTEQAVRAFIRDIARNGQRAPADRDRLAGGPGAKALETAYGIVQGAMSWISDVPEFAREVAESGGMPTLALGLKDRLALDRELGCLPRVLGGRPYAVNFLALPENPHLEQQLRWIEAVKPPFAVIAAGDPSCAARLLQAGIRVIYIAPSEGLMQSALAAGVRLIVLEGHEAGGHVGEHSTLTLAQIALERRRRDPALFDGCHIILAGGIYDRETAFRAVMLGADAIQMGTAYLATRELVATGGLKPLYQRLITESGPGSTTISGESVGLRIRALATPKVKAICAFEEQKAAGVMDEDTFRHQLETLSTGSLLIAARGRRAPDSPELDEETCFNEGQFMSGAIAGNIRNISTVGELHREVAEGVLDLDAPELTSEIRRTSRPHVSRQEGERRVAITGMAVANSLGRSPQAVWSASLSMASGITEVPASRWDHAMYYDPDPRALGKTYCKVGAFMDFALDRKDLDIAPQDFRTMADSTRLTLWLAEQAIRDSGILESGIPRERIGVIVSQNSGETAATALDLLVDVHARDLIQSLRGVVPMTPELQRAAEQEIRAGRLRVDDTTLLGRLNCAAVGFICNRYGFQGPGHAVTAACASSLVALFNAIQMIRTGVLDAAVIGGGEELLHPTHFLEFSALKALAGHSGIERAAFECSRPFDATRDGMVLGEGGAMLVIERESLAESRGAAIHAIINGVGASNSHQGLVESLAETQLIAMRGAFRDAGYGPDQVDLVECHATSTVQGDVEEVKALGALFPSARHTVLTSFKSQIGHTLGASGLNSLIHGIMAMKAGVFPATLNYRNPDPAIDLERFGFQIPREPGEWPLAPDRARRIMVNAFGFGGSNYVVQLESRENAFHADALPLPSRPARSEGSSLGGEGSSASEGFFPFRMSLDGRWLRIGIAAESLEEARERVGGPDWVDQVGKLSDKSARVLARKGVFAASESDPALPLALVFAGQGTQYPGMGRELYRTFPIIRSWVERMAALADFDLVQVLFSGSDEDLRNTLWQQPALYALEYAMARHFLASGVRPVAMAGHSLGELVALALAGAFSWDDGFRIVTKRAECMEKAGRLNRDPGIMIAVDTPLSILESKLSERENVYFTNFNSPRQVVLGGSTTEVLALSEELKREGHRATRLNVSMAFHSPAMSVIRDEMQAFVDGIRFHPTAIPVVSNTTMEPFPEDPQRIREILMAHLERPVHWMQNVTTLWDRFGSRLFVEVGPRETLCNLIADTFPDARCLPTCSPESEAGTMAAAAASLYACGHLRCDRPPEELRAEPPAVRSVETPLPAPSDARRDLLDEVVQREINAFLLESFGRILKPRILEAIRRESAKDLTAEQLDELLEAKTRVFPEWPAAPVKAPVDAVPEPLKPSTPPENVPAPLEQPEPASSGADRIEQVIRIIMDATGYDRDEIEPDMDLRKDLAIRSSRFPVIMDAAERHFGITINLPDFIGVRTVREVADRIGDLIARAGQTKVPERGSAEPKPSSPREPAPRRPADEAVPDLPPIRRFTFREVPLGELATQPLPMLHGKTVAILALNPDAPLTGDLAKYLRSELKAVPRVMGCLGTGSGECYDLRVAAAAEACAGVLGRMENLAGLALTLDDGARPSLGDGEAIAGFLSGWFRCMKSFMASSEKTFCVALRQGGDERGPETITAEGVLGMFLAGAQEYPSVLFRCAAIDAGTSFETVFKTVLDAGIAPVQLIYREGKPHTLQSVVDPLPLAETSLPPLAAGDVILLTGGGRGITYHVARALAPFRPRLALMGRSRLDPAASGGELAGNLAELTRLGMEVLYLPCDVSDPEAVSLGVRQVVERFGRIDGIVHGAAVVKDAFLPFITPEDFDEVMKVKLPGALNLYRAARDHGLRFFLALSSIACIQGNLGQINYCGANRAMSGLIRDLAQGGDAIKVTALMLPPIEGAGMADDPEVRELMKLKGIESAYVHVDELTELVNRELLGAPPYRPWVMFGRVVPPVKQTLIVPEGPESPSGLLHHGSVAWESRCFPMVDRITRQNLRAGELEALRTFDRGHDLWIEDHRPFKFLKHPLVSGTMAIEALMEAARLLTPYLRVTGIRNVGFEHILDCPPEIPRQARIHCLKQAIEGGTVVCGVTLASPDLSPSGRQLDSWTVNYRGQVLLGLGDAPGTRAVMQPVTAEELDSRPMDRSEVQQWYEKRTAMQGRYRVIETLDGSGLGAVSGRMRYPETDDFAGVVGVRCQYPSYLLEALVHLVTFYIPMRDEGDMRHLIPAGLDELSFVRGCRPGERLLLEARLVVENPAGVVWNAKAMDADRNVVMDAHGLKMSWFAE
ncbi:MAG: SDR family NAD(P)-dependent oxidoreductase [Syntrophobacteraceae bacterium]